jgi:5-methyltetrahydrofolate--homocysteine methyltransferase
LTFEKTGEKTFHTMMGITPMQMVEELVETGVAIIGANCGNGIHDMIGITEEIRKYNKNLPILIHANAGVPIYQDGKTVFPESPADMAAHLQHLVDAGANIIVGCCGTTPDHIRLMAKTIQNKRAL